MILVVVNGYELSEREQHLNVVSLPSLEKLAKEILPKDGFDFIRGGSEDEWTLRENTIAFNHTQILPHVLSNIGNPETKTSIFGLPLDTPIVMAPAAAQGVARHNFSNYILAKTTVLTNFYLIKRRPVLKPSSLQLI